MEQIVTEIPAINLPCVTIALKVIFLYGFFTITRVIAALSSVYHKCLTGAGPRAGTKHLS